MTVILRPGPPPSPPPPPRTAIRRTRPDDHENVPVDVQVCSAEGAEGHVAMVTSESVPVVHPTQESGIVDVRSDLLDRPP